MSYIETFEAELAAKIDGSSEDTATIVRWVAAKVLESYRNGIEAGQNGREASKRTTRRPRPFPPRAQ